MILRKGSLLKNDKDEIDKDETILKENLYIFMCQLLKQYHRVQINSNLYTKVAVKAMELLDKSSAFKRDLDTVIKNNNRFGIKEGVRVKFILNSDSGLVEYNLDLDISISFERMVGEEFLLEIGG